PAEPRVLRCLPQAVNTSAVRGGAHEWRRHAIRSEIVFDEIFGAILDAPKQRAAERAWARADAGRRRAGEPPDERARPHIRDEAPPREISAADERRLLRRQLPKRRCRC